ncbi:hypothetical protein [uncultured Kordia sp.]|uniref:hypothetical protein n=1 Tax=uncultured Kordia sp. TaxID=507699 RepID=UPI00260FCE86|nr:hypothetical protein [uncultured Kordia sp.]
MAEKSREELKGYFQPHLRPTGNQFEDLIDSFVSRLDDDFVSTLPDATTTQKGIVEQATLTEVQAATDDTRFVTPKGAKRAAETFAPVQSINGQTGNVVLNLGNTDTGRGSSNEGILKYYHGGAYNESDKYFHIKLPYKSDVDNKMYYIQALGYSYKTAEVIDVTWVGYCYASGSTNLINTNAHVDKGATITAGQYIGSDNHIYLWFKPEYTYVVTFKIDTIRVGNGTLLQEGDLEVIVSTELEL